MTDIETFRSRVRRWCAEHVPTDWRQTQTGADDAEFVRFQKWWFAELNSAGFAVPHWPAEWGGEDAKKLISAALEANRATKPQDEQPRP